MIRAAGIALAVATVLVAAACGGDDDDAAADAAPPQADARPLADGGTVDPGSAWQLLSCGVDPLPDAGPELDAGPEFDAGPPPDAGTGEPEPPVGLGESCCDPTGRCEGSLECIGDSEGENGTCRPLCEGEAGDECPHGGVCASFGTKRICIPAAGLGDECAPELCEAGLICVGESEDSALCRARCEGPDDCPEGETCTQLTGSSSMACL